MQLYKQVKRKLGSADNIIYVGPGLDIDFSLNIIYLTLNISHQVDISYNQNLECFVSMINHNNKHKAVIKIQKLLVKKRNSIQQRKTVIFVNISNYLYLQEQVIRVRKNYFIESLYIQYSFAIFFVLSVNFLNNKHK